MRGLAIVTGICLVAGFAVNSRAEIGPVAATQSAVTACIHTLSQRYDKESPGLDLSARPDDLWADLGLAVNPQDGTAACASGFEDKMDDPGLGSPGPQSGAAH